MQNIYIIMRRYEKHQNNAMRCPNIKSKYYSKFLAQMLWITHMISVHSGYISWRLSTPQMSTACLFLDSPVFKTLSYCFMIHWN